MSPTTSLATFLKVLKEGLENGGQDLDSVTKFIEGAGQKQKLNLQLFGDKLFEILITGKLSGSDIPVTKVFAMAENDSGLEHIKAFQQVFTKLIMRFGFLEDHLRISLQKIFYRIFEFGCDEVCRIAQLSAILINSRMISSHILDNSLLNRDSKLNATVKHFMLEFLKTSKEEFGREEVIDLVKRLDLHLSHDEKFEATLIDNDLSEVLAVATERQLEKSRCQLSEVLQKGDATNLKPRSIVAALREVLEANQLTDGDALEAVLTYLISSYFEVGRIRASTELLLEQICSKIDLFVAFSTKRSSQDRLLDTLYKCCSESKNLSQLFVNLVTLFLKRDVLTDEIYARWFKDKGSKTEISNLDEKAKTIADWIECVDDGKPPLEVTMCKDLVPHRLIKQTNIFHIVAHSDIYLSDKSRKANKLAHWFDFSKDRHSLKYYIDHQDVFVEQIENLILESVKSCRTIEPEVRMVEFIADSEVLFSRTIQVFSTYLLETEFDPLIVELFRTFVKSVHKMCEFPVDLYPPELKKLLGLIFLFEKTKDKSLPPHLRAELGCVLKLNNPILGKIVVLLFPEMFGVDVENFVRMSELSCLATEFTLFKFQK